MNTADMPDGLLLDYRLDGGVAVVKVTGEVDVSTSSSLRNSLLRVIADENHHGLVVNLASVSFLIRLESASWSGSGTASVPLGAPWPWPRRPVRSTASWKRQA